MTLTTTKAVDTMLFMTDSLREEKDLVQVKNKRTGFLVLSDRIVGHQSKRRHIDKNSSDSQFGVEKRKFSVLIAARAYSDDKSFGATNGRTEIPVY
jgi:hypothetical protein